MKHSVGISITIVGPVQLQHHALVVNVVRYWRDLERLGNGFSSSEPLS